MIELILSVLILLIEAYLLFLWFRSRRNQDGRDGRICLYGFLVGQIYILWETILVGNTGLVEKRMFMARFVLGGMPGGLFTVMGLFYVFGVFRRTKSTDGYDEET